MMWRILFKLIIRMDVLEEAGNAGFYLLKSSRPAYINKLINYKLSLLHKRMLINLVIMIILTSMIPISGFQFVAERFLRYIYQHNRLHSSVSLEKNNYKTINDEQQILMYRIP